MSSIKFKSGIDVDGVVRVDGQELGANAFSSVTIPTNTNQLVNGSGFLTASALNGYASSSHTHTFASLTSKPTTLSGYGITDAAPSSHSHTFASLTNKPTTLSGYGISDAASASHTHTFASLTSKPTTLGGYGITDAFDGTWASLSGKPSTFNPSSHTHTFASLTSKPTTLGGYGITDAASTNHKYHTFNSGEYYYDSYGQGNYLRLFTQTANFDQVRFRPYSNVQSSSDGTNWVSHPNADAMMRALLDGREDTGYNLPLSERGIRFEINRNSGWPTTALVIWQETWSGLYRPDCTMSIETWDGSSWVMRESKISFNGSTTASNYGTHLYVSTSLHNGQNNIRVTVVYNDWSGNTNYPNYPTVPLRNFMILSNYSGLPIEPFSWNYDQNLYVNGQVYAAGAQLATQSWVGSQSYLTSVPSEYLTQTEGDSLYQPRGSYQAAGTYNTIIGTDTDISTSGATIIGSLTMTDGVITAHSTRNLTLANLGYTGATNANYITNNNQLTNGAGYITSSALSTYATQAYVGTEIGKIVDSAPTTLNTLNELAAALGDDPNFATTIADSIGRKLDASVNPITGATVSNDTITFTKSDASTFAVSISDANTWRGIDDVPVNGQTAESISSNWAYDHTAASNPHGTTYSDVGAAAASHTHTIANVTGLQSALDGKAASSHTHAWSTITSRPNPIVSASYNSSGDIITFTHDDATTTVIDIVDNNSNTYVTGASFNATDGVLTLTRNSGSVTVDLDGRYLQSVPAEYLTKTDGDKYYQPVGNYQAAGTYNTIIGTDTDINTSGSTIIDNIYVTDGVITSMGTRTLTLADLGYSGATNANYITNNNQLTNGAGYVTSSGNTIIGTDSDIDTSGYTVIDNLYMTDGVITSHGTRNIENLKVPDTRAAQKAPNDYIDYGLSLDFTDKFTGLGAWYSGITVKGWTDGYAAWQLIGDSNTGTKDEWYLRSGVGTTWNSMNRVWHNGNLNPIVSATVSNDTTTFTKADGSTFALTTSDANSNTYVTGASFNTSDGVLTLTRNSGSVTVDLDGRYSTTDTNTWRGIHDSPVNGATTTSISSNWAYDNVRNFSSGGNSLTGSLTCTGDVIAYSDMRLKSNVETIDSALEKVEALRGVSYEKDGKKSVGVIAQEVADVIPEVVSQDGEYLGVAYGNLVGVLIEAVKELSAEVKELKSKLGE